MSTGTLTDRVTMTIMTPRPGPSVRRKTSPGDMTSNYYGAPTPAASVGSGNRAVPAGQGSRSFAKGLARRRAL